MAPELSEKVMGICGRHDFDYHRCPECPLSSVCSISNDDLPGSTQAEKTAAWEQAMNNAAEEVLK